MPGRNIALSNANWSVHVISSILVQTMKMCTGALVAQLGTQLAVCRVWCLMSHTWLCRLTMTRSPFVKFNSGRGHCPLMPMTGRSAMPSGFALTQPTLKSWVTVAASTLCRRPFGSSVSRQTRKFDNERAIAIVETW